MKPISKKGKKDVMTRYHGSLSEEWAGIYNASTNSSLCLCLIKIKAKENLCHFGYSRYCEILNRETQRQFGTSNQTHAIIMLINSAFDIEKHGILTNLFQHTRCLKQQKHFTPLKHYFFPLARRLTNLQNTQD